MEPDLPALKITAGVHQGALIRLDTADMLVIGSSDDCDVILADPDVSSHHCVLKRQGEQFFVRTMDGTLSIDGHQQDPGATLPLAQGMCVSLGSASFELVRTSPETLPIREKPAPQAEAHPETPPPTGIALIRQLLRQRPLSATATALVAAVMACALAMRALSFGPSGHPVAGSPDVPVTAVATRPGAAVAHDVAEVLRLSGITCEARYNGDGTVTVRGHLGDSQALAAIVNSRAIREIVGLKRVMAVNLDQAGRSAQGPVDGTRIVSVVASADPYVVTADGSRYYVGASLPQGGRLAGVKEGEVLVERDGRTEHWKIAEPGHGSGEFRPTTNFLTDSAAVRRRR